MVARPPRAALVSLRSGADIAGISDQFIFSRSGAANCSFGLRTTSSWFSPSSDDHLDIARGPRTVVKRLPRTIETESEEVAFARLGRDPVRFLAGGRAWTK